MTHIVFLEGASVYLRPLAEEDLTKEYQSWLNDAEICQYNSHAIFPYSFEDLKRFFERSKQPGSTDVVLAIVSKGNNKHIGNISLQNIDWVSREAEFAILLGDKSYWNKGIASEAALLICDYGFKRLNLNRIQCGTSSENTPMQKLAKKMKMLQEGVRRQAMYKMGKHVDIIEYGVLKDEFYKS
jgi:RimJ/RimL family protein N-acetyltransferase